MTLGDTPLIVEPRDGFDILPLHVGHSIECVGYSPDYQPPWSVVHLRCATCDVLLLGYAEWHDSPSWEDE